jgi:hypothetical protein
LTKRGASAAEAHCNENLSGLTPISLSTLETKASIPIAS